MKLLLIADTHGMDERFEQVLRHAGPFDMLLHAGDLEGSEYYYRTRSPAPALCVAGNNDLFTEMPAERLVDVCGLRIWLVHGHRQHVFRGLSELESEALRRDVQVVVFGHTHRPLIEHRSGLMIINPGSLSLPRGRDRRPSWAELETESGKITDSRICYLP